MHFHIFCVQDMDTQYRCYHCKVKFGDGDSTVRHCLEVHPEKNISILKPIIVDGRVKYKSVHFSLSGTDVLCTPTKCHMMT